MQTETTCTDNRNARGADRAVGSTPSGVFGDRVLRDRNSRAAPASASASAPLATKATGDTPAPIRPQRVVSPVRLAGRPSPSRIPATLRTVRTIRGPRGARELIARLTIDEPVAVRSRLTRGKRLIGGGRALLVAGTHEVRLKVSAAALGGEGKLTVVLTDQAGHRRTLTKPVTVPMAV